MYMAALGIKLIRLFFRSFREGNRYMSLQFEQECMYIYNYQAVHYFRTIEITKSYLATLQQPSQASSGIHTPNHHNLPIIRLVLQHLVASRPYYIQEQTSHTYYAFLLNIKIGSTHILRHFVIQIVGNSIHEKAPALLNVRNPPYYYAVYG